MRSATTHVRHVSGAHALHCLDSDKVGKSYERDPNCDKKNGIGNEIREDHEDQSADEGDDHLLLLAVHEEAEPH